MSARLPELEPAHLAAFTAFRRDQNADDVALAAEYTAVNHLDPKLNPALARRVYSSSEGVIYLVPGPGQTCCVAISTSGETMTGTTLTALIGPDPMGCLRGGPGPEVTFMGVLPAGGRDLRVLQRAGRSVSVPLSEDEGYWATIDDPIALVWTAANGRTHRLYSGRFQPHLGPDGPGAYFS